jgi:hypothetical protein
MASSERLVSFKVGPAVRIRFPPAASHQRTRSPKNSSQLRVVEPSNAETLAAALDRQRSLRASHELIERSPSHSNSFHPRSSFEADYRSGEIVAAHQPEELLTHVTTVNGERPKALIRAEIVYFETIGDGAVFSTGSITFCGSISHNNYENNVSRMLENVLCRFRA